MENERAAIIWSEVLKSTLMDFRHLVATKPELIKKWAQSQPEIPGLISHFRPVTKANEELVKRLGVGECFHLPIVPKGNATQLAEGLRCYIQHHIDYVPEARANGWELPPWIEDAMELPPFSSTTWDKWAAVACRAIEELSPDGKLENHPGFYDPATKISNVRKARADEDTSKTAKWDAPRKIRKSPSIARNDLREDIFDAFELLATGVSSRTRRRKEAAEKARKTL